MHTSKVLVAGLLAAAVAAGCAPEAPPRTSGSPPPSTVEPQRQFLSEAQAARARYYWTAASLEPYGIVPGRSMLSGT